MNRTDDPLSQLKVIDRLEIGPVGLEAKRLVAPYTVIRNGKTDFIDLIYRYEEPVFDPADPGAQNLADMIAAQVALNYGLFCEEIVFRGSYDGADRQFLHDMAENTACEIYVKKFLHPNPFLIGEAANMPVIRPKSYLQSKLLFPDEKSAIQESTLEPGRRNPSGRTGKTASIPGSKPATQNPKLETPTPSRYLVLSSGGKDSLLSFGLLNELGCEAHPVFGNESGRHWFTALNAYRYFKANVPNTGRVWMNSDRVFSRMKRHLPFIRPDFARLRADMYPIRLWTVAVFLFGALPLMRKRGLERLIIGDEYDTTVRENFRGIAHYDGLYDQSRYFDEALSAYFRQKGWGIRQFSLLRPLSELLIEKILVERYPHLQAQQVSCHAAHKKGERVHPCGKCEKCRRIVGMLMALGADPARCGYAPAQITHSLQELGQKGIHQEEEGFQQLLRMLMEKGLINLPAERKTALAPQPEVLHLRFHPEKSPPETIPEDLRTPLYRLYLEHARGALRFDGRGWSEFDPVGGAHSH